ncbi:translation initiation factor IF-2, partial [Paenibacillus sp. IHB B 3415]|uniref:translation initiation factor IF-2 N-terminal domain-containing protein n=1 Tax=Paenibacillus sp. IHB B 3415 TaxID=867080 RepID=UPI000573ACAF
MTKEDNKDKLRVYEYAKSLNMSSKEIITILKRLNVPVNNHMSVMENGSVNKVEQFFKDIKSNAAAKRDTGTSSRPVTTGAVTAEPQSAQNANKNQPEKQVGMNSNQNNNQSTTSPRPQSGQDSRRTQTTGTTQNSRPQGSSTTGSRPQGSSTSGSRPQGSSTTGSRPQGSSTGGSRPQGSSTGGSRPQGSSTGGSRPQGSSTGGSRPQG